MVILIIFWLVFSHDYIFHCLNKPNFLKLWLFFFSLFFVTAELCGHLLLRVLQQLYSKRQARGTGCPERSSAFHCIVQESQGWAKASGVAGETTTNSSVTPKRAYVYPGGGGGWYSIKFNTWRLRSPVPYIVCHFGEKGNPFLYLFKLMDNTRGEHQAFSKAC